jgi:hypothetical protein
MLWDLRDLVFSKYCHVLECFANKCSVRGRSRQQKERPWTFFLVECDRQLTASHYVLLTPDFRLQTSTPDPHLPRLLGRILYGATAAPRKRQEEQLQWPTAPRLLVGQNCSWFRPWDVVCSSSRHTPFAYGIDRRRTSTNCSKVGLEFWRRPWNFTPPCIFVPVLKRLDPAP